MTLGAEISFVTYLQKDFDLECVKFVIQLRKYLQKWRQIKNAQTNQEEVKRLEASIAQELGSSQQFRIQQTEVGVKTETIVLLDSVVDEPNIAKSNRNDLVSLALTESGIQDQGANQDNPEEEDSHYEQLADEILG